MLSSLSRCSFVPRDKCTVVELLLWKKLISYTWPFHIFSCRAVIFVLKKCFLRNCMFETLMFIRKTLSILFYDLKYFDKDTRKFHHEYKIISWEMLQNANNFALHQYLCILYMLHDFVLKTDSSFVSRYVILMIWLETEIEVFPHYFPQCWKYHINTTLNQGVYFHFWVFGGNF